MATFAKKRYRTEMGLECPDGRWTQILVHLSKGTLHLSKVSSEKNQSAVKLPDQCVRSFLCHVCTLPIWNVGCKTHTPISTDQNALLKTTISRKKAANTFVNGFLSSFLRLPKEFWPRFQGSLEFLSMQKCDTNHVMITRQKSYNQSKLCHLCSRF